jgi:hypothetical protein
MGCSCLLSGTRAFCHLSSFSVAISTATPSDHRPFVAFALQGLLPPPPLESTMKIPPFGLNDDEDGDSVEKGDAGSFSHFPAINMPVDTLGRCEHP